ncbi:pol II transcription elongation factor [Panaeolus papilionaceus]|nr:pol II transcription elongation factor [Panaeolus papilionaceus]
MRNLALISSWESSIPSSSLTSSTYDLDENAIYLTSERKSPDGEVDVDLWKLQQLEGANKPPSIPELLSTFQSIASNSGSESSEVLSLRFLAETRRVAVIMRGGDVITVSVDEDPFPPIQHEVEGTFESGILAASWSPDESLLSIVTGENKLLLLTSTFDVVSEAPIYVEEFGQDAPINVGWGSKQTQFHGSQGKAAAVAKPVSKLGISPDDDNLPRISWRGMHHRMLRVYDRQGVLQSTSEDVAGLEHTLSWRPSGNLIASTQRFGYEGGGAGREGRHDIIFYERNGLRHGEFTLPSEGLLVKGAETPSNLRWGYRIRELSWNSDSNVLAIWIYGDQGDVVQLWSTGNYHWYLKHEVTAPATATGPGRFSSLLWHPETALSLSLTTESSILHRAYSWDTCFSSTVPPNDSGAVAVIDGSKLLLTPFRSQNVPPPMSSFQLPVASQPNSSNKIHQTQIPVYVTFSSNTDHLAVLWEQGYVEIWSLQTRLLPGPTKIMDPVKTWSGVIPELPDVRWRQAILSSKNSAQTLVLLGSEFEEKDVAYTFHLGKDSEISSTAVARLPYRSCRLLATPEDNIYQNIGGEIFLHAENKPPTPVAQLSEQCIQVHQLRVHLTENELDVVLYIGLAKSGKLFVSSSAQETRLISGNATSFTVASGFVIFTTSTHEAIFAPVTSLPALLDREEGASKEMPSEWQTRKVERGSRIVLAVPTNMALVLQMPRGNLETINPRPLVMEVVRQDLNAGNYRKAFFACRKHRIDLNVIVEHNLTKFKEDIPSFIEQIPEVDHLNLFLTLIGRGELPQELKVQFCDAFIADLEKRDLAKYVNSILTAHVVKTPPDHEAGLALLHRLQETDPEIVEDAVKYIIFLVDADRLFDTALGMYDFSLVLLIAQHAQKDPREYLPFLRELRALDKYYQRFKIDDHLKRYQSALKNLSLAGPVRFDEAIAYVERYQLYDSALAIWKGTEQYEAKFRQAATVFIEAKRNQKAMIAYEKALDWQELFDLAVLDGVEEEELVSMGYRVAEDLSSKKRYLEAGRVLLDYSKDIRDSVIAFVQGNAFSEARRNISLYNVPELLVDIVHPGSLESRNQISEDISEMREQIRKQLNRIRELRVRKVEEPDAFYDLEDDAALHNVDVMTDVSMPATAFTRYTQAPTSASRSSRRTSRSKRKMERKIGSGKKGTVDEEEYLLRSVTKLVEKFSASQADARSLLPHLYQFTVEHRTEGKLLQEEVDEFEAELKAAVEEIWAVQGAPGTADESELEPTVDTWATRMAEREKKMKVNPLERVPKPTFSQGKDWRVKMLDTL